MCYEFRLHELSVRDDFSSHYIKSLEITSFFPHSFSAVGLFLVHCHKKGQFLESDYYYYFTDSSYSFTNFSYIFTITYVSITHKIQSSCQFRLANVLKVKAYFPVSFTSMTFFLSQVFGLSRFLTLFRFFVFHLMKHVVY